jgi:hypothetical protein
MKYNKSIFVEKANIKYDNKYNYFLTEYINNKHKIKIICPVHGLFITTPERHLLRVECPICSGDKLDGDEILKRFINIHGNKYDYSLVNYINYKTKVKIICDKHGIFEQSPNHHISGKGCPKCAYIIRANKKKYTTEIYIEKAGKKHNYMYDYSLVKYVHSQIKIKIICPIHGIFEQKPNQHLSGQKCPYCQHNEQSIRLLSNKIDFIKKAEIVHNNKYDYSKVVYVHSNKKIIIICPKHGKFEQLPVNHLMGQGCVVCSESKGEKFIREILKKNNIEYITQKTFDECKGKIRKLPFDFYLPEKNTLIEYNGEQHYMPVKYFGGTRTFERIKKCDEIKKNFAKDNKLNLIEIKYDAINDIENILINEKVF